jgi:hypothetical protein
VVGLRFGSPCRPRVGGQDHRSYRARSAPITVVGIYPLKSQEPMVKTCRAQVMQGADFHSLFISLPKSLLLLFHPRTSIQCSQSTAPKKMNAPSSASMEVLCLLMLYAVYISHITMPRRPSREPTRLDNRCYAMAESPMPFIRICLRCGHWHGAAHTAIHAQAHTGGVRADTA